MIPRIIHYCWFGGSPKSKLIKKCIKSWSKHCPDYKIVEWNENNFEINSAPTFVRQAYEYKKWAFVSDYVRLKAVYENGGVYFDTDVELLKNIDGFLYNKAFFGFNEDNRIATGLVMGAEKGCKVLFDLMENYCTCSFVNHDGTFNLLDNTQRDSVVFEKLGVKLNNNFQTIDGYAFYPKEYFCPMDPYCYNLAPTKNTISIHYFYASWSGDAISGNRKWRMKRRYQGLISDLKTLRAEKGIVFSIIYALKNWIIIFKY